MRGVVAKRLRTVYGNPAMEVRRYFWRDDGGIVSTGKRRVYQAKKKAYLGSRS